MYLGIWLEPYLIFLFDESRLYFLHGEAMAESIILIDQTKNELNIAYHLKECEITEWCLASCYL